jgi:hypothetical protein
VDSAKLTPETSGFVLAAGITVLLNTVLSCAKDAFPPLKSVMRSLAGHDWTTQGLIDLALFIGLGLIFTSTRIAERIDANRLIAALIGAVLIAALGLGLWFAYV